MSTLPICRYISILIISGFVAIAMPAYAQTAAPTRDTTTAAADTTANEPAKKKVTATSHQLCLAIDIAHPVMNTFTDNRYSYEAAADYALKNEFYAVAEGGWGGSKVNYTDLAYTTTNSFFRAGFNKSALVRDTPNDWDMMFVGMRLAYARVSRSAGTYQVLDSLWGNSNGTTAPKNFSAAWAELTGGMRVELAKGLLAGWNIRGKFLLNGKSFKDIAPLNIAGYGKGDKNANFDFNVYVIYAIRWKKAIHAPLKPAHTRSK